MSNKKREDSYFAASRKKNKKYMMIVIPVVAALVAVGVAAAVLTPKGPSNSYGPLGSAHEHAVFEVRLDGKAIDFSQSKYQVKSQFIHVEGGDGTTLHRHATGVPVGAFFQSIGMDIDENNNCFISDDGSRYCDDGAKQLRYFVNGTERDSITDYVLSQNDRILIIYGSESQEQLQAEFDKLDNTPIKG
ncbi:MAG TPA: hypothetical protein VJP79_11500 [Nitrososphaera sp.]|nr:hypothetical protein [Nitrososphaera sp.]